MRAGYFTFPLLLLAYKATTALTIHDSCNNRRSDIQAWIDEAAHILDRATVGLNDAINRFDEGNLSDGYKEILDAILGPTAGKEQYETAWKRLAKAQIFKNEDMIIRCDNPITQVSGVWDSYQTRGPRTLQLVYPVKITRIDGNPQQLQTRANRTPWWFTQDRKFLHVLVSSPDRTLAYCIDGTIEGIRDNQDQLVGYSDGRKTKSRWSDIVLGDILQLGPPNYKQNLHDNYDANANQVNFARSEPYSITIIHELMHSHLVHLRDHANVNINGKQKTANGIIRVLKLAAEGGDKDPVDNPDTLAWLALCFTMPWLKFWDRSQAPAGLDGRIRSNQFTATIDGKVLNDAIAIPAILETTADELKKGPYCAAK